MTAVMGSAPFSVQEYAALTTLRTIVKALNRIVANPDSFRSPLLRRLVEAATNVLRESITEIESYDPEAIARERKSEEQLEANIVEAAEREARTLRAFFTKLALPKLDEGQPAASEASLVPRKKRTVRPDSALFARHVCPYCGKEGTGPIMKRHHFDRCPKKPVEQAA